MELLVFKTQKMKIAVGLSSIKNEWNFTKNPLVSATIEVMISLGLQVVMELVKLKS